MSEVISHPVISLLQIMDAVDARDLVLLVKAEQGLNLPRALAAIISDFEDSFIPCKHCNQKVRVDEYYEKSGENWILREKFPDDGIIDVGSCFVLSYCDPCKEQTYGFICGCMFRFYSFRDPIKIPTRIPS